MLPKDLSNLIKTYIPRRQLKAKVFDIPWLSFRKYLHLYGKEIVEEYENIKDEKDVGQCDFHNDAINSQMITNVVREFKVKPRHGDILDAGFLRYANAGLYFWDALKGVTVPDAGDGRSEVPRVFKVPIFPPEYWNEEVPPNCPNGDINFDTSLLPPSPDLSNIIYKDRFTTIYDITILIRNVKWNMILIEGDKWEGSAKNIYSNFLRHGRCFSDELWEYYLGSKEDKPWKSEPNKTFIIGLSEEYDDVVMVEVKKSLSK